VPERRSTYWYHKYLSRRNEVVYLSNYLAVVRGYTSEHFTLSSFIAILQRATYRHEQII